MEDIMENNMMICIYIDTINNIFFGSDTKLIHSLSTYMNTINMYIDVLCIHDYIHIFGSKPRLSESECYFF